MNPAPDHGQQEATDICGNVPDFRDDEDFSRNPLPRPILGRRNTKGDGNRAPHLYTFYPTFGKKAPIRYQNRVRISLNTAVGPELSEESKPLLPEATNSGKFYCWISRVIGNYCWAESRA